MNKILKSASVQTALTFFLTMLILFLLFGTGFIKIANSQTTSGGFEVKGVKVLYEGTRVIDSFGDNDVNIAIIEIQYSTSGLSMSSRYKYYIVATGLKTGDVSISPLE